jgi:hypothetical protein
MGIQQNLPHHGNLKAKPDISSSSQFTEKRLLNLIELIGSLSFNKPAFPNYQKSVLELKIGSS